MLASRETEFCFPDTLNAPQGEAERNIEGRGKPKLTVSRRASHLVFCYTSQLKNKIKKCEVMLCLAPLHTVAVAAVRVAVITWRQRWSSEMRTRVTHTWRELQSLHDNSKR